MTTLFLIRHGLTAQTGTTLYGRSPSIPLDERGLAQARALTDRFEGIKLTAIYSSPLERCTQTVEPLAEAKRLAVIERPGLIEMDAGSWTGRPLARLRRLKAWSQVQRAPATFAFPGGEGFAEALQRAWDDLEAIARRHPRGRVAVATHGDIARILLCRAAGSPLDAFQRIVIDTASVSVISLRSGSRPYVHLVNDTAGLGRFRPQGATQPWEAAAPPRRRKGNLRG
jgi:probable phosphomutase (TIGR03848 family)